MASTVNDIHPAGLAADRPAASSANRGYLWFSSDEDGGKLYRSDGADWIPVACSVDPAGSGALLINNNLDDLDSPSTARTNLGLGNVNNTADADKPVSDATQDALDLKADAADIGTAGALDVDTDGTLAANSDSLVPSQKAVKTFVGAAVTGLLDFKGATDASGNPNYPAASKGDAYIVSVAGKIGGGSGIDVAVGDWYIATADNAGGTHGSVGAFWAVLEHNLVGPLLSANNLSDVASASAARTNLGLAIGSDVQGYDAELAAIAALTSAADKGIQFTGAGAAATFDLTTAGKALLDDADAAAQRTTLGLGTAATLASDTDTALSANSDSRIATQKAVKAYIDAAVVGLLDFKGSTDCSANPNYPAALKGDAYVVSVAGKIGGAAGNSVDVGDVYVATADNAGGTQASVGSSWSVLRYNLTGALLVANNLSDLGSASAARGNLGLGTAAVVNVPASGNAADTEVVKGSDSRLDGFFSIPITGNGSAITAGSEGYFVAPYDGVITRVTLSGKNSGSIVLDLWKTAWAGGVPTVANTITASAKPTLSSARQFQDSTLTGWTKTVTAFDQFVIHVDSCADITELYVIVEIARS